MKDIEKRKIEQDRAFKAEKDRRAKKDKIFFRILFAILIIVLIALSAILIRFFMTADERAERNFDNKIEMLLNVVRIEHNKANGDYNYAYVGYTAESYKEQYIGTYRIIKNLIGLDINDDFYVLKDLQLKQFGLDFGGTYLVNYERELVFNLTPYKRKDGTEKYTVDRIIDNFEIGKVHDKSGANEPVLYEGMKAIIYNEMTSSWEYVTDDEQTWANYSNKIWANAMLSDTSDEDTMDGSIYVWIPRFAYKISPTNYHTFIKGTIDIKFLVGTSNEATDGTIVDPTNIDSSTGYVIHPAFNAFGGVPGIWVSKFEGSNTEYGTVGTREDQNSEELVYKSVADAYSWANVDMNVAYTVGRNMINNPIYGLNKEIVNTHLMKNTEWGAIAYLAQSKFGNADIWSNNYYDTIGGTKSGYAARSMDDTGFGSEVGTTTYLWNTDNGKRASTTGNVYGVYDMVGGASERVAAYLNNGSESLSKFGLSIYNEGNMNYVDTYYVNGADTQSTNYAVTSKKVGDALYETSSTGNARTSWGTVSSEMANNEYPFFFRGGSGATTEGSKPGIFYFGPSSGGTYALSTFRTVICKNQ